MEKKINEVKICIPQGFFGSYCSDCIYWEEYNRLSDGRVYCSWYDEWFYPSRRCGCFARVD